jgi:hypothetical protein
MRSLALALLSAGVCAMQREERRALREEARDLFTHAWDNYMEHAFPMDVLLPMSCKGSDAWGGMSMTVLDTLDTLAIMGNASEFERMVNWCIAHIDFDIDETVSVFETNIRALGGLISAHLLAIDPRLGLMSGPCASGLEVAQLALGRQLTILPWPPGAGPPSSWLRQTSRCAAQGPKGGGGAAVRPMPPMPRLE